MSRSRWHMNRLGLVDFWCYNDEEFLFENGHMLLRGSNGSGKSVTMQSFIPLLLDGNKSSERLDPFGTRSRKMETYLIDENSERNERIGYLYLEFKREDSDIYKTIGMGLHARKSQPLKSWYFVIEDNRRVNKDFWLMENQLTINEKQLRNILGDQVISSQKEYMKRVNDALFGFENLEEYSDAIGLLLQLRSPKLSNSLSPSKINEILGKSLQPLSDDELRPMSEAIVNMDNLQDQLEALKQSFASSKKLEQAYDTYNKAVLLEKWNKYKGIESNLHQILSSLTQKTKEKKDAENQIEQYKEKREHNNIELQVKKEEYQSLKMNDIDQWIEKIHQLKQDLNDCEEQIQKKTISLESKDNRYQDIVKKREYYLNKKEESDYKIKRILQEMDFLNETLMLSEHIALTQSYKQNEEPHFAYSRQVLDKELNQVSDGLKKWGDYDQSNKVLQEYENTINTFQNDLLIEENKLYDKQEKYKQTVEEYNEFFHRYSSSNTILKLSQDDLKQIRNNLIDYENTRNYNSVSDLILEYYQKLNFSLENEKMRLSLKINSYDEDISALLQEKETWEKSEDIEPERKIENQKNREYLRQQNISFIPLYQLLDFDENLTDMNRNYIEELLIEMNLLDALILNEKNRDVLHKIPLGNKDHYLWTHKEVEELQVITIHQLQTKEDLMHIMSLLGIDVSSFEINERYFKSGIIEGSLTLQVEAKYIGYESRLRLKENKIKELNEHIHILSEERKHLLNTLHQCEEDIQTLLQEYRGCVNEKKLKDDIEEVDLSIRNCQAIENQINRFEEIALQQRTKIQILYSELQKISSLLQLDTKKEVFESYYQDLQSYRQQFELFKEAFDLYQIAMNQEKICLEHKQELETDIDNLQYEIETLTNKKKISYEKIQLLQKQLDDAGYKDISKKLNDIQNRIQQLDQDNKTLDTQIIQLNTSMSYLEKEITECEKKRDDISIKVDIYKDIYNQEYNLHLVFKEESISIAEMKILSAQMTSKKTIGEYQNQLQRVFFEQTPYLSQYNVVQENYALIHEVEDLSPRLLLKATTQGKRISFLELIDVLNESITTQELLIDDEDRHIFEEILVNTIGKKLRDRIQESRRWVEKIQSYMNDMNTSSGLALSMKWRSKKSIDEKELDTQELIELLEKDYHILKDDDRRKISNHFRYKIETARKLSQDENTTASFHQLMKEVMDYRQWFDFTLYAKKPNENKKELTSHVFYAYSGGEKALSMYVPLFSAVAAKFESAREDAPLLIALDEAFAGVDENNINNMFALINKFNFDYIMNSQVLWGDYPSCPSLAIYELFRPNNAPYVTVIAYVWNGNEKRVRFNEY